MSPVLSRFVFEIGADGARSSGLVQRIPCHVGCTVGCTAEAFIRCIAGDHQGLRGVESEGPTGAHADAGVDRFHEPIRNGGARRR
jgi:hypothetical protein